MPFYSYHVKKYYNEYATEEERDEMDWLYQQCPVPELREIAKSMSITQYSYRCKDELCLMIVKKNTIPNICSMW